jgi:Fungal specific transcription factor domain
VRSSLDRSQSTWALVGLAIRIAQGLELHRDGDGQAFIAFEGEIRRRLWWQIMALDMRTSEGRGSEPILAESSFNTVMPCNLNDEELKYDSQCPIDSKIGPTEMAICLLTMDALYTSRMMNFASRPNSFENSALAAREVVLRGYAHRVESIFKWLRLVF